MRRGLKQTKMSSMPVWNVQWTSRLSAKRLEGCFKSLIRQQQNSDRRMYCWYVERRTSQYQRVPLFKSLVRADVQDCDIWPRETENLPLSHCFEVQYFDILDRLDGETDKHFDSKYSAFLRCARKKNEIWTGWFIKRDYISQAFMGQT